jgi:fluoroquinolone resistance protein
VSNLRAQLIELASSERGEVHHDLRNSLIAESLHAITVKRVDFTGSKIERGQLAGIFHDCVFDEVTAAATLGKEFRGCTFRGVNFEGSVLRGRFIGCKFVHSRLVSVRGTELLFEQCLFEDCDFRKASLVRCTFNECVLARLNFRSGSLARCKFTDCTREAVELAGAVTVGATFDGEPLPI